jgi:alpha-L-rhamnosidase
MKYYSLILSLIFLCNQGCDFSDVKNDSDLKVQYSLLLKGLPDIKEPYRVIHGGAFNGPSIRESVDPLVSYRWDAPKPTDSLQIYFLKPVKIETDSPQSFDNISSATKSKTNIVVKGSGSIQLDFGVESGAWIEFVSPDCPGDIEMSISEFNRPGHHKTIAPIRHGNTWRLEINEYPDFYDGVRFAWIHIDSVEKPWHITDIRAVCQVKPTNYNGSFSCSDPLLTRIWYMAAYSVKVSLCQDYFGAILVNRGDRMSWTGDAHTSQAAALVAFSNLDFIKKNIENTSGQDNGIRSYALYWVLSLLDYFHYSGDTATLEYYIENVCGKLNEAYSVFGTDPNLRFYGWDDRLCAGFELWFRSAPEAQRAYKMLSIHTWKEFSKVMKTIGRTDLQVMYESYAKEKIAELQEDKDWSQSFGIHAASDAINSGSLTYKEQDSLFGRLFEDRLHRLSFSPFNQYFLLQAMAKLNKYDEALNSVRDIWGGMLKNGATTSYEVFWPTWNEILKPNDPVPNSQSGLTSLCHPWGAGVVKWLNEEILGIKPTKPGFATYDIMPHPGRNLTHLSGETPTPSGGIRVDLNFDKGNGTISSPHGTIGRLGIPKLEKRIAKIKINRQLAWDGSYHSVNGISTASENAEFIIFTGIMPGIYDIDIDYEGQRPRFSEPEFRYAAKTLETDSMTSGNWGEVYGSVGYILCNYYGNGIDKNSLPNYVRNVEYFRAFPKNGLPEPTLWAKNTIDTRALSEDHLGNSVRNATCYSNTGTTMTVTIDIEGKEAYQVALYFVDWESEGHKYAVEMMDAKTLNQIAPVQIVKNHTNGVYIVYNYDQSVKFRINSIGPRSKVSLSGIFLDSQQ